MNSVKHFEVPADDVDRAKKFYGEVFGWTSKDMSSAGDIDYHFLMTTEVDEKMMPKEVGAINGGIFPRKKDEQAVVVVQVTDIHDSVSQIENAGGEIIEKVTEIGDMGWYAKFVDTEGNHVGVWQDKNKKPE